jgi:outer membrane protein
MNLSIRGALICILLFAPAAPLLGSETLTLDECIRMALENNPQVVSSREAVGEAQLGITVSRSSFFPRLQASSGYSKSGNGVTSDSYSSSITLSQTLFQGGSNLASVRASRAQVDVAQQNLRLTEDQIVESVKEAFYEIGRKEDRLALTDEIVKRRNEDFVLIGLKHRAGTESDAAVSESESNLRASEYDKMSAEEGLRLAKIHLNLLLGRPKETPIQTERTAELPQFPAREDAVLTALRSRPEIAREEARIELQNAYLSQSRSEFYPELSFSSSLSQRGDAIFSGDDSWSAGLSLSLPIFQGMRRVANYSQSKASLRQQEAQYTEVRQTVEEDIENAYSDWLLALKRMDVAEKTLSAAKDMYTLTRLQYQQGRASYFVFQQRELSLTQAETEKVNASYDLLTAAAKLTRALGTSSQTPEGER